MSLASKFCMVPLHLRSTQSPPCWSSHSAILSCNNAVVCKLSALGPCAEIADERSSEQAYSGSSGLRGKPRLAAGEIRPTCSCLGTLVLPGPNAGRLYLYGLQHTTRAGQPR